MPNYYLEDPADVTAAEVVSPHLLHSYVIASL